MAHIRKPMALTSLTVCLLLLLLSSLSGPPSAQGPAPLLVGLPEAEFPLAICGTSSLIELQDGIRSATPLTRGEALDFVQQPPILTADYNGEVTIRDLGIVGDVRTVKFHRNDHRRPGAVAKETWRRTRKQVIGGRTISRFTKSWPASVFRQVIRNQAFGYDNPQVFWGTLKAPVATNVSGPAGTDPQTVDLPLNLRLATNNLPQATVRKINNRVQYSSHVVNLVVNNFSVPRLTTDNQNYNFVAAAKLFYRHFPDVYDGLAFVMARDALVTYAAFHRIVRNQVGGIGRPLHNDSASYGSGGKLKAVEIYTDGHIATNSASTHEAMHQWADYFNLAELAGYTPAGHQPRGHMSLVFPRENYVGAVLEPERRVRRIGGDVYAIRRTPSPVKQHPLHLYAMGKANAGAVPNLIVFENQDQFGPRAAAPEPGTTLTGGSRVVTMNDIIAMHGQRSGPNRRVWRRATVLISTGRLATQEEMDYWNFYAKRIGEPLNTTSYQGHPSFFQANGKKMRLRTDIEPTGRPKVTGGGANHLQELFADGLARRRVRQGGTQPIQGEQAVYV